MHATTDQTSLVTLYDQVECDSLWNWQRGALQHLQDTLVLDKTKNNAGGCFILCAPRYSGKTTVVSKLAAILFATTPNIRICITSLHRRNVEKVRRRFYDDLQHLKNPIDPGKFHVVSRTEIEWRDTNSTLREDIRRISFFLASDLPITPEDIDGKSYNLHIMEDCDIISTKIHPQYDFYPHVGEVFTIYTGSLSVDNNNAFTRLLDATNADGTKRIDQIAIPHECQICANNRFCRHAHFCTSAKKQEVDDV